MFDNILSEPTYVQDIYRDYLNAINRYKNYKRPSIFSRYLNINENESIYDKTSESTFDYYHSGVRYDVYDFTPLYSVSPIINETMNNLDLKGQMFSGNLTVIVFSIEKPHDNDLLVFSYPPQSGSEIFKVTSVRTVLNALKSTPAVNWFELTLEYAPVIDLTKINILNQYVYSLVNETYMRKDSFRTMLQEVEKLTELFEELQEELFNEKMELYLYEDIAPLSLNNTIFEFLTGNGNKYFQKIKRPFGIKKYGTEGSITTDEEEVDDPSVDVEETPLLKYTNQINIFQLVYFIENWKW